MTYQEYFALREQLAKAEQAYLNAWKACKSTRKRGKRLSALAQECLRLNDLITAIPFYK